MDGLTMENLTFEYRASVAQASSNQSLDCFEKSTSAKAHGFFSDLIS